MLSESIFSFIRDLDLLTAGREAQYPDAVERMLSESIFSFIRDLDLLTAGREAQYPDAVEWRDTLDGWRTKALEMEKPGPYQDSDGDLILNPAFFDDFLADYCPSFAALVSEVESSGTVSDTCRRVMMRLVDQEMLVEIATCVGGDGIEDTMEKVLEHLYEHTA